MPRGPLTRDAFREGVFARDRHRCVGELSGLPVVATLDRGIFDASRLQALAATHERHRVRHAGAFTYAAYRRSVGVES